MKSWEELKQDSDLSTEESIDEFLDKWANIILWKDDQLSQDLKWYQSIFDEVEAEDLPPSNLINEPREIEENLDPFIKFADQENYGISLENWETEFENQMQNLFEQIKSQDSKDMREEAKRLFGSKQLNQLVTKNKSNFQNSKLIRIGHLNSRLPNSDNLLFKDYAIESISSVIDNNKIDDDKEIQENIVINASSELSVKIEDDIFYLIFNHNEEKHII